MDNYYKCLEIQKEPITENNPETAATYHDIGLVYRNQGDYKNALENYIKCLEIYKSMIGDNNLEIATTYYNIA